MCLNHHSSELSDNSCAQVQDNSKTYIVIYLKTSVSRRQSALTDSDLTDAAVEGSWGDIVAAAAGVTLYRRRKDHIVFMVQNW